MLSASIEQQHRHWPQAQAVWEATRSWSYKELAALADTLTGALDGLGGALIGVKIARLPELIAALTAAERQGVRAVLLRPTLAGDERLAEQVPEAAMSHVLQDGPAHPVLHPTGVARGTSASDRAADSAPADGPAGGEVVLFTSGTSGPPRPVRHRWETLAAAVHRGTRYDHRRWLLTYDPMSFAGLQVWLQAILSGGTVCLPAGSRADQIAAAMREGGAHIASGTPTMWRMLLTLLDEQSLRSMPLEQITLGGEAVDQPLLDQLAAEFPQARITHIYASTEMGVCFSVHDGRAGFPAQLLEEDHGPCQLKIDADGQLLLRSTRAMLGYVEAAAPADDAAGHEVAGTRQPADSSWFATGDSVLRRGDRVYFTGRFSGAMNIGGRKVYAEEVERAVRQVPGVSQVRAFPQISSVVGQLVQIEVVAGPGAAAATLEAEIRRHCQEHLPHHAVPATIRLVDALPCTDTGKIARAESSRP